MEPGKKDDLAEYSLYVSDPIVSNMANINLHLQLNIYTWATVLMNPVSDLSFWHGEVADDDIEESTAAER